MYDIQNANGVAAEEMEPIPLERGLILTENGETISSFAWHLNEENRLLYSSTSLHIKVDITGIPCGGDKVVFDSSKYITGTYSCRPNHAELVPIK